MSSLLQKIEHLLSSATAQRVEHFVITLGGPALKVAATSPLGTAILGAIKAGEAGTNPVQKIGLAIESLTPTIVSYALGGGAKAAESDAETVARIAIEQTLAQLKTTGPLAIIQGLEKAALGA